LTNIFLTFVFAKDKNNSDGRMQIKDL